MASIKQWQFHLPKWSVSLTEDVYFSHINSLHPPTWLITECLQQMYFFLIIQKFFLFVHLGCLSASKGGRFLTCHFCSCTSLICGLVLHTKHIVMKNNAALGSVRISWQAKSLPKVQQKENVGSRVYFEPTNANPTFTDILSTAAEISASWNFYQ